MTYNRGDIVITNHGSTNRSYIVTYANIQQYLNVFSSYSEINTLIYIPSIIFHIPKNPLIKLLYEIH